MAATFPDDIERITASEVWIFDSGGPPPETPATAALGDLMWTRADTLVWLDHSQPLFGVAVTGVST